MRVKYFIRDFPVKVACFCLSMGILFGCQSAYYKTMETFGIHKRDLMVDRVQDARDAQEEAKEEFKTTLEQFKSVVKMDGGALEEKYTLLNDAYERSKSKSEAVKKRIDSVENVSGALFAEWESELSQYTNKSLRQASKRKLDQTRKHYTQLIRAMKRAEKKIRPVLSAFYDQVLFLKHNLNARAIASLQNEFRSIESDVASLIREMESSIAEANAFINAMAN
jgi:Protein of unknown function (DUF2959)